MKNQSAPHIVGQSLWLNNLTRRQLQNGAFVQYVEEGLITGAIINSAAFGKVLKSTDVYDAAIRKKLDSGLFGERLAQELILEDARHAADLLRPVFDSTGGVDGWVSLAFPQVINDFGQSVVNLCKKAGRPNILITLPGLPDLLKGLEDLIFSMVPVNIACIFSCNQFLEATHAYMRAMDRRVVEGLRPLPASFVSIAISPLAAGLSGILPGETYSLGAVALARRIYRCFRELRNSLEWERLCNYGARPLRLIWTIEEDDSPQPATEDFHKNYVAPLTVVSVPESTLEKDMARIFSGKTMPPDGGDCEEVLARYETAGVDLDALANDLQRQLSAGHMSKWIELLDTVAYKSAALTTKPRYVKNRR